VEAPFIRAWRETTNLIEKQFYEGASDVEWDEADEYPDVMAAFDRLEAVSEKYPPTFW
jgi:hypothetical protein